jgi:transcriptional regulator with XRE-family HTH domain
MAQDYSAAVGARLRVVRHRRGMTLQQVEQRSAGRFTAAVVGSYERGDRAVTVPTLAELAEFYDVPTAQLLPQHPTAATGGDRTLRIDLHRLAALPAQHVGPLARYASAARSNDDDSADGILTLREQDLQCLSVLYALPPDFLIQMMIFWGVLADEPPGRSHTADPPRRSRVPLAAKSKK